MPCFYIHTESQALLTALSHSACIWKIDTICNRSFTSETQNCKHVKQLALEIEPTCNSKAEWWTHVTCGLRGSEGQAEIYGFHSERLVFMVNQHDVVELMTPMPSRAPKAIGYCSWRYHWSGCRNINIKKYSSEYFFPCVCTHFTLFLIYEFEISQWGSFSEHNMHKHIIHVNKCDLSISGCLIDSGEWIALRINMIKSYVGFQYSDFLLK